MHYDIYYSYKDGEEYPVSTTRKKPCVSANVIRELIDFEADLKRAPKNTCAVRITHRAIMGSGLSFF